MESSAVKKNQGETSKLVIPMSFFLGFPSSHIDFETVTNQQKFLKDLLCLVDLKTFSFSVVSLMKTNS